MAGNDDPDKLLMAAAQDKGRIERKPSLVDAHVGARIRERRQSLGFSLEELSERIGVGPQQLQKYETGANRISASRLFDVTQALGVPIGWFYMGINREPVQQVGEPAQDVLAHLSELISVFVRIDEPASRQKLLELAQILAKKA